MSKYSRYSLKRNLLTRLFGPLFIVLMLGFVGAFTLAEKMGATVYDDWLLDSAMSLSEQLTIENGKVVLDLPTPAIQMFEWDKDDQIFEEVLSRNNGFLYRSTEFPTPSAKLAHGKPYYYDGTINGYPVRIVAIQISLPQFDDVYVIQVAETKQKRESLTETILWLVIPFMLIILVLTGATIWFAVTSSLSLVNAVADKLSNYEPSDLPSINMDNTPDELNPLINSINKLIDKLSDFQNTHHRFIANAAHQLRTPLTTLQVQTERALREPDPIQHKEALSSVLKALKRLRRVTHQLLTLARSEASNQSILEMRTLDLAILVREELEHWTDSAISKNIDLGYDGPESGVLVTLEQQLISELIGNLIDNAIRYIPAGGQITLTLQTNPIALIVDDNGPGIPFEERDLVLEPFYRPRGSTGEGCGLGLAIANEIAARHGLMLEILDNPTGQGARIKVAFRQAPVNRSSHEPLIQIEHELQK